MVANVWLRLLFGDYSLSENTVCILEEILYFNFVFIPRSQNIDFFLYIHICIYVCNFFSFHGEIPKAFSVWTHGSKKLSAPSADVKCFDILKC